MLMSTESAISPHHSRPPWNQSLLATPGLLACSIVRVAYSTVQPFMLAAYEYSSSGQGRLSKTRSLYIPLEAAGV
jgi:hypothetical protein